MIRFMFLVHPPGRSISVITLWDSDLERMDLLVLLGSWVSVIRWNIFVVLILLGFYFVGIKFGGFLGASTKDKGG